MKTPVSVYSVYQVLPKLAIRLATAKSFAEGKCTAATPGKLLRHGRA
jgi:hypothetical protein